MNEKILERCLEELIDIKLVLLVMHDKMIGCSHPANLKIIDEVIERHFKKENKK